MPAVTVLLRPKGLPIATTQSPTWSWSEFPILTDDLGTVLFLVRQGHGDVLGALDDVAVGDDDAVGAQEKAGSRSFRPIITRGLGRPLEKPVEILPEGGGILARWTIKRGWYFPFRLLDLCYPNVHDGRREGFRETCEARQRYSRGRHGPVRSCHGSRRKSPDSGNTDPKEEPKN